MATFNAGISVTADDAADLNGSLTDGLLIQGNISAFGLGNGYVGLRFNGVTVAQGATVSSATLTLKLAASPTLGSSSTGSAWGSIKGVAADDAPAWTTTSPTAASKTTASVTITNTATWAADVTAIVQEIVNRGGWVSGNDMAFAGDPTGANGFIQWEDYAASTSNCAQLSITYTAGGGGGIAATASITLGAVTTSSAAKVAIKAAVARTLGAVTTSSAGKVALKASASVTLGALTSSSAAKVAIKADASVTLGSLAISATGAATPVTADASITLGALTLSSAGALPIVGAASFTLGDLTTSATGALPIAGAASVALGAVTTSSTGSVALAGALNATLGDLTSTSVGSLAIAGSAGVTLGDLTVIATGELGAAGVIAGEAAITLGALTLSAVATLSDPIPCGWTDDPALTGIWTDLPRAIMQPEGGFLVQPDGGLILLPDGLDTELGGSVVWGDPVPEIDPWVAAAAPGGTWEDATGSALVWRQTPRFIVLPDGEFLELPGSCGRIIISEA